MSFTPRVPQYRRHRGGGVTGPSSCSASEGIIWVAGEAPRAGRSTTSSSPSGWPPVSRGGRARTVGIDPAAGAFVERWLEVRSELGMNGTHPVFCTLVGARMGDAYIRVLLPRLARKAGIEKRVHAHGLRHTHAAQLRAEGVDIGIISKQLGHRSIATTARYLDHIAPQLVIETIRRRRWQTD